MKLLASQTANYARKPAADLMNDLIRKFPQIDGVLAANDPMALGALDALGPNRRKALVVGINASRDAADLIKSGQMVASGDYNGFVEGCVAAQLAIRILRKQAGAQGGDPAHHRGRQEQCRALRDAGREAHLPDRGRGRGELTESPPSIARAMLDHSPAISRASALIGLCLNVAQITP